MKTSAPLSVPAGWVSIGWKNGQEEFAPAKRAMPISLVTNEVAKMDMVKTGMRVRQQQGRKETKIEREWCAYLRALYPLSHLRKQALKFQLCNGVTYTPDIFSFGIRLVDDDEMMPTAWEVKGDWATDDAKVKIKMAPTIFPEIRWIMVWRDKLDNQFRQQRILP